ncbi:MAG: DUF4350 domain-containing protein [Acidobacteriota bacterium]|jgi:hypothetical protein|nr:DUF4350 domain-containing protein [Acidobacteriota bacterium]
MPLRLSAGDRKIMLATGAVFAVLTLAIAILSPPDGGKGDVPTTWSVNSSGAKAAFLLLQESGYDTRRHTMPPSALQAGAATLILAEPTVAANGEELEALRRFVRGGGVLVAVGPTAYPMLPGMGSAKAVQPAPVEQAWEAFPALAPTSATRAAPQITMAPRGWWTLPGEALPLYGRDGKAVVVRYPYGEGVVHWWAAATPLTNAGLKEPGSLEFFLATLGGKGRPVIWDEYFHGHRDVAADPVEAWLLLGLLAQAGLLGFAAVWTFARRSGPLRPSLPESRLSPLEFVETLGNLYHRAHAAPVAVEVYHQRFVYWLTRRLGMPCDESPERLEQAMRDRWGFQDAGLSDALRECSAARRADVSPRRALEIVRALHSGAERLKLFPGAK